MNNKSVVKTTPRAVELEPFQVERWAHATTTGAVGRKAVLQYLASRCDEQGSCFPGQQAIASATEQGERTIRRHLAEMSLAGLICHRSRPRGDGRGRSSDRYFLHVDGECSSGDCPLLGEPELPLDQPAILAGKTATNRPTETDHPATGGRRGNSQSNSQPLSAEQAQTPRKTRSPDPTWDAVIEACGLAGALPTRPERGAWNRAVGELRAVGATPEEIRARAKRHRRTWPKASLTPTSLARHWGELAAAEAEDRPAHWSEVV